jgi:hypothetical protein
LTIENDAGAHAGAGGEVDEGATVAVEYKVPLGQGIGVGVVHEECRCTQCGGQNLRDGNGVSAGQVGRTQHGAGRRIEGTSASDAHGGGGREWSEDGGDFIQGGVGCAGGKSREFSKSVRFRPLTDGGFGAADVDAVDERFGCARDGRR